MVYLVCQVYKVVFCAERFASAVVRQVVEKYWFEGRLLQHLIHGYGEGEVLKTRSCILSFLINFLSL